MSPGLLTPYKNSGEEISLEIMEASFIIFIMKRTIK